MYTLRGLLLLLCLVGASRRDIHHETEQGKEVRTEVRDTKELKLTQNSLKGPI